MYDTISGNIQLRFLQSGDVEAVATLFSSAFVSPSEECDAAADRIACERKCALVATANDVVMGAIYFEVVHQDNYKVLYLERVAVAAKYRRNGICSAILAWTLEYAKLQDCQFTFLIVNGTNTGAISCYEKNGFTLRDSRKHKQVE